MARTQFKYPPCISNPNTEKPFTRHKWVIVPGLKQSGGKVTYAVRCERCGLNDPRPPSY